ncbi:MAG: hypothetical protein LBP36_02545, partial [Oscillospiraceae bacterium]|nr:hypothetical protein [Oscillospiraceae bacterium]
EKLSQKIAHIYATDGWESYNLTDPAKHVIGKAHTFTVERTNPLLRHYIARFARKFYSVSKSFSWNISIFSAAHTLTKFEY